MKTVSPLKVRLLLMLIKEYNLSQLMELIPYYLNVLPSQIPYLLELLRKSDLITYNEKNGNFQLSQSGKLYLKQWNLLNTSLETIEANNYEIDKNLMENYIPE